MALAALGNFFQNNSKTAGASFTAALGANVNTGELLVVVVASDNRATTDTDDSLHSSVKIQTTGAVDVLAFTKVAEFTNGQGAADGGATVSVWRAICNGNYTTAGHQLRVDLAASKTAKAMAGYRFSRDTAKTVEVVGTPATRADDGADAGAMSSSGLTNEEHLHVRGMAYEGPNAALTVTTNWTSITSSSLAHTSGGGSATNMGARGEFRINTSTGETSDPTWGSNADQAAVLAVFREVAAGTPVDGVPLDLVWDMRAAADGAALDLKWDMVGEVSGAALDLKWDLATPVDGGALDLLWDVRAQADAAALDLLWDLRAAVDAAPLDLVWDLAGAAPTPVDGVPLDLVWDLRGQVDGAALDLTWDTRAAVDGAALDLLWDLRSPVDGAALDLVWDLEAEAAGPVNAAPLRLVWDLDAEEAEVPAGGGIVRAPVRKPVEVVPSGVNARPLTLVWDVETLEGGALGRQLAEPDKPTEEPVEEPAELVPLARYRGPKPVDGDPLWLYWNVVARVESDPLWLYFDVAVPVDAGPLVLGWDVRVGPTPDEDERDLLEILALSG